MSLEKITLDGVSYVREDLKQSAIAEKFNGMEYKIVRTYSTGVFAGYVESRNGEEVKMVMARRLWYWDGAASLSQIAISGVTKPQNCKFAIPVSVTLLQAIEILDVTAEAKENIEKVAIWVQK
jgi:hypothetical protein